MKIAQYVNGRSWGTVGPETLQRGLGGRETAAIQLAEQWAKLGHDVTTFAYCDGPTHNRYESGGVASYVDHDLAAAMLVNFEWDVALSWETPEIFTLADMDGIALKLVGMQVAHVTTGDHEVTSAPDAYVALSNWARVFLAEQISRDMKIEIQPNCVDLTNFRRDRWAEKVRVGPRNLGGRAVPEFLYASSPDRGLNHLLDAWPKIRSIWPDATLHVVYGAKEWANALKWSHQLSGEMAADILIGLEQDGVVDHGKIGQKDLAELHFRCDALLYPCDPTAPTETGCITVMEAMAAGNVPITTTADCLKSEFGEACPQVGLPYDEDEYVELIEQTMNDASGYRMYQKIGREFIEESRTWDKVAPKWIEMIDRLTLEKQLEPVTA